MDGINQCDRPPRSCQWCGEVLEPDVVRSSWMHSECAIRAVVGSVAHLEKRCSCFVPGSTNSDNPHLSRRDAARMAAALWQAQNGLLR